MTPNMSVRFRLSNGRQLFFEFGVSILKNLDAFSLLICPVWQFATIQFGQKVKKSSFSIKKWCNTGKFFISFTIQVCKLSRKPEKIQIQNKIFLSTWLFVQFWHRNTEKQKKAFCSPWRTFSLRQPFSLSWFFWFGLGNPDINCSSWDKNFSMPRLWRPL